MTHQFYVCKNSCWEGDTWAPVLGIYPTRREALDHIGEVEHITHDAKTHTFARVYSRSQLRRMGWNDEEAIYDSMMEYERMNDHTKDDDLVVKIDYIGQARCPRCGHAGEYGQDG